MGFAGLLDIGYVAFFGIGSYVYALLCSPHFGLHLPFLLALPIVVIVTALFGVSSVRRRCAWAETISRSSRWASGRSLYLLLVNLDRPVNITNGPSGLI